jgi:hypothetical protein
MADEQGTPDAGQTLDMGELRDAFVDGVDSIEMGDDGFLDMQIAQSDDDFEYEDGGGYELDQPEPQFQPETPVAEPEVPWEKRYNDLRPEYSKVTQENSELRKRLDVLERQANVQQQAPAPEQTGYDVPEDLYDLYQNPKQLEETVGKIAKEVIDEAMSLYVPSDMVAQWRVNNEIQQAMLNHGDFTEMLPHIETVYKRFPDSELTIEQAYELASFALESVKGQRTGSQEQPAPVPVPETPPATPAPTPALSREELIARSQRLQTAEGNTNDEGFNVQERIETPRDAIMAALADMED